MPHRFILFIFSFALFLSGPWVFGQELRVEPHAQIQPDARAMQAWLEDIYQMPEIWLVKDQNDFVNFLKRLGVNEQQIKQLKRRFDYIGSNSEHRRMLQSFYDFDGIGFDGGSFTLNNNIKKTLTDKQLSSIYKRLYDEGNGPINLKFDSIEEYDQWANQWKISPELKHKWQGQFVKISEGHLYYLVVTPDVWRQLPPEVKSNLIQETSKTGAQSDHHKALKVSLELKNEDEIKKVAKKYAIGVKPEAIERFLLNLYNKNGKRPFSIALEKILSPFIRKNLNHFDITGNANCLNASLCVHQGAYAKPEYVSDAHMKQNLESNYRLLSGVEPPQAGDLVMYRNSQGQFHHAAIYIDKDLLFTKNGYNKFQPYIFQTRSQVDNNYGGSGERLIYRHKSALQIQAAAAPGLRLISCLLNQLK